MRTFTDHDGRSWVADAREERTPRHHGRWYLVFHEDRPHAEPLAMPEIRWQTQETAHRTVAVMSVFELRRRLAEARSRHAPPGARPDSPAATR